MRGSTLHRSGLTREKMGVLATFINVVKKQSQRAQLNQYQRVAKNEELDLLYEGSKVGMHNVRSATKSTNSKSPVVYLIIGFLAGVIFMTIITLIVSFSAMTPKTEEEEQKTTNVAVVENDVQAPAPVENVATYEKYVVKSGDTLNGIAYRFYGRYNEAKIQEIQRVNEIKNPAALKIGQELMIPVSTDR